MMFPDRKECTIEFEDVAKTEIIHVCADKAVKNCTIEGDIVCSTIYETSKFLRGLQSTEEAFFLLTQRHPKIYFDAVEIY